MAPRVREVEPLRHAAHGEPAVRGHFLRCAVAALDALTLGTPLPPEVASVLPALHHVAGLGWLPIARLLPLVEAAHAQLGASGARELVLDSMRRAMGAPLWRRMIMAALRSFGLTLPAMTRWVPRLYALVFRDTGAMHVPECDASRARIDFEAVPALCFTSPAYLAALGHALEFYFELSGSAGSVELIANEPSLGRLSYSIRVDASAGPARSG